MTLNEWKEVFGDNLASILKEKKMSQSQLAKRSGVSTGMISDYINKRSIPGIMAAINMAYALDVSIEDFVDFDEPIKD